MHQVRTVRPAHHVPAAPLGPPSVELSREEREQLRAVRHHAFERVQRNAAWTRELLQFIPATPNTNETAQANGHEPAPSDEINALKKQLEQRSEQLAEEQQRHADLFAALRVIGSGDALAACRARIEEEAARHAHAARKEPKVIRL